jgi:hypothetical protein
MMRSPRTERIKPAVTDDEIRPDLIRIGRRAALRRGLSLGGLALLTGCDLSTHSGVDAALWAMLRFDDRVQAALFSRRRLARTYPVSAVTKPFRFNAYYEEWQVRDVPADWRLEVSGLVAGGVRSCRGQGSLDVGQTPLASQRGAGDAAHLH